MSVEWQRQGDCFTCKKIGECFPDELIAKEGLHPLEFMDAVCEAWQRAEWATGEKGIPAKQHIDREALRKLREAHA